jgi:hypothetical protein
MIKNNYFDKIIAEYLKNIECETTNFLKNTYRNHYSREYFSFFDSFLGNYGINSISYDMPDVKLKNKYIPYLNFQKHNIFNEKEGIKELSNFPLSNKASQEVLANYLIGKLNFIRPDKYQNWKEL